MTFARLVNNIVQELVDFDPGERFAAEIAALFEEVPVGTLVGYNKNADGTFSAPVPVVHPVIPPPPPPRKIILTKLEYMNRFTDAELAGIYTAAKTVVAVEIWLEKFKLAAEINLDDPATSAGLLAMEAAGLLAAGRSSAIIA